jgi:Zn/Cd-binding protein ZinT
VFNENLEECEINLAIIKSWHSYYVKFKAIIMLQPSRTWPTILQKTMAVVQLRFDGKYAYSTIASIKNPTHKLQTSENQISIASEQQVEFDETNQSVKCAYSYNRGLHAKCRSCSPTRNSRQHNEYISYMNKPTSPVKLCFCGHIYCNNRNRKRSESIKVDNWDFIYRERLNAKIERTGTVPKYVVDSFLV